MYVASITKSSHIDVIAAYRDDVVRRSGLPLDDEDGHWIRFGLLLSHAARMGSPERDNELDAAVVVAREILGPILWNEGYRLDPERPTDPESLYGRIRSIAERAEDVGGLALSDAILTAFLEAVPDCDPIEVGRIEATRARLAWKRGELEVSHVRYARVAKAGRDNNSSELKVRALTGEAILARLEGNYPRSSTMARAAFVLAERAKMVRLAANASHTLMVTAAIRKDFNMAIKLGWAAFERAKGDAVLESEVLGNIAQIFLDLGHPRTAASAFYAVLRRNPPTRVQIPALGGLAVASARLGRKDAVETAAREIAHRAQKAGTPYGIAVAHLELSEAYSICADPRQAAVHRMAALRIAEQHKYHELVYRAESMSVVDELRPSVLTPETESVASSVRSLVGV